MIDPSKTGEHEGSAGRGVAAAALAALLLGIGCARQEAVTLAVPTSLGTASLRLPARESRRAGEASALVGQTISRSVPPLQSDAKSSDIAKINEVAHTVTLPLAASTFRVIDLAHYYSELTGGAFDITAGRLTRLWGLRGGATPAEPPTAAMVSACMEGVGPQHLQLFDYGAIALLSPATELDLGLLPLAYSVDLSVVNLRRGNIAGALLEFAHCARCIGSPEDRPGWELRLPDPLQAGQSLGTVTLPASHALVSRVAADGGRIDPATGHPAAGTAAAFVLGPTAIQSHALAEALMVLGVDRCNSLTGKFPRCSFLIVPDRHPREAWVTEGFAAVFVADPAAAGTLRRFGQFPAGQR
jgi:FAD:protein FMN transferase